MCARGTTCFYYYRLIYRYYYIYFVASVFVFVNTTPQTRHNTISIFAIAYVIHFVTYDFSLLSERERDVS